MKLYYFKVDFISFFQLIRDLGPLEWILNTPKHHRVHHGKRTVILSNLNAGYIKHCIRTERLNE